MAPDTKLASGVFKFSSKITPQALIDFVKEHWVNDPNFIELHVRGCDGERKFGIGFKFRHSGDKKAYDDFIERCIGKMTVHFPGDFVGWDVCSSTYSLK